MEPLWPLRERNRLGRQEPRTMPPGALLQAIPGLAAQFRKPVPDAHLVPRRPATGTAHEVLAHIDAVRRDPEAFVPTGVDCTCGGAVELAPPFVGCDCGRWFLRIGGGVLCAGPYPKDPEDA